MAGVQAEGHGAVVELADMHHHEPQSFWRKYVFSTDHKVIAVQFMMTALLTALLGGLMAALMRVQLGWPDRTWPFLEKLLPGAFPNGVMSPDFYYGLVTMHGTVMVFFFLTAILSGGFGNFLIPLQIGARDMAFPILNMISYWLMPPSVILAMASFFVQGGAPGSGWTAYPPLSAAEGPGQTLWLLSAMLLLIALAMGGINYITTVLNMRAPGLSMTRLPLSVWALFITAIVGLFIFPVLFATCLMLLFDQVAGTLFFVPTGSILAGQTIAGTAGGDPLLYQHLFWFFGHPEVYVIILPSFGLVSEILANNARKPIFGYRYMVGSLIAIAVLSYLVWGHHMFTSGMNPWLGTAFMTMTLAIAIPSAVKTFNWLATLWGGRLRFTSAMLFAVGFVSLFVTGGLTGLVVAHPALDIYVHDTYFVVAHFHIVMASAALFAVFGGIYHWFPKFFGRMMNERLGRWHFWLTIVGIYGTFFPMHFLGMAGMMRRVYTWSRYEYLSDMGGLNVLISIAAFMLIAAQLLFAYNFLYSLFRGPKAERNPWQANSLEWSTPSPAPHGNFGPQIPTVYRWAFEYSSPNTERDYAPQWEPLTEAEVAAAKERS